MTAIPFVTLDEPRYGEVVTVAPLVHRVIANNPSKFTYLGTGTYIVGGVGGGGTVAVIDPGPTNDAHRDKWSSVAKFETIEVQEMTVSALLKEHPGPFNFLSLDVEGQSADMLELFDLSAMGVELVCVEHDDQRPHIQAYCRSHGLTQTTVD